MGNLKKRLEAIAEKIEGGAESCILVKHPDKPGVTHGGRTFDSVEAAVEILEKELGRRLRPTVLKVVYDNPQPPGEEGA